MFLLNYFGEKLAEPCGHCDNCDAGVAREAKERNDSLPFPLKSRVKHSKWGEGVVMRYEADKVVVLFDTEGEKQVVTRFVIEKGLMEAV
jgi:ATP-dependent DNA helicase RecQ